MMQVAAILFAGAFTYAASFSAGLIVLKLLRIKLYRMEMLFVGFVFGAACLSTMVFALTVARLAYTGVFLALGLLLIAGAVRMGAWRHEGSFPPLALGWRLAFLGLYALFAILYIGNALLPEISPDGLTYHVALVARYFREHRLPGITTNFYASFPEGLEMLFLFGFAFGRHAAAAMVHLLFLLTLPLGMLAYARRFGSPVAGVAGGLLFFLSPVAAKDGTIAYNDVGLACVVFACFYVVQIWRERRDLLLLFAAGLLAGFAYAVKYNGGLAVVYVLGMTVFHYRKKFLRPAMLVMAGALLMMGPW
ncbi:MAG TPA: glycosyltransferase family 39 protein, partial [Bryobacteraceae bacterium]|nr:glycosyltransferase family 39 protein [Bryobacteraceae bacterium]